MDVQVTIKISRESLTEVAEIFYQVFKKGISSIEPESRTEPAIAQENQPQMPIPQMPIPPMPQPVSAVPTAPPVMVSAAQPVSQQSYSEQVAQKTQLPVQAMTGAPAPTQGPPTTAVTQEYSQDQVAVALSGLIDAGKRDVALQILAMFGAQALTQIPKERYPELVLKLREAGANI